MSLNLPFWKLRRELGRLGQQLRAVAELIYEPFLRWRYDRKRAQHLKVTPGHMQASGKVAVYLIFQPRGLADSSLMTCRHLGQGGYAPLVVSNAALGESDRSRLQAVSWKIVERPNFGYDFGGYRDGVWLLQQCNVRLESLILMNDSIWFPALEDDQTIATMEAMSSDFKGVLKLGTGEGAVLRRGREPFLSSFFLMFSAKALTSKTFTDFWQDYRNTSNKYKTIRRGERRLSYVMREAGFEGESLFDRTALDLYLIRADHSTLRYVLDELVSMDKNISKEIKDLILEYDLKISNEKFFMEEKIRKLIFKATTTSNVFSTIPTVLLQDFSLPFIKKSQDPWNIKGLEKINQCIKSHPGRIKISNQVSEEIYRLLWR